MITAVALLVGGPASAGLLQVAVASNFSATARLLARDFTRETGHLVRLSTGSTGGLYAQITQGAPYDLYLAADQTRPAQAVQAGLAVAGTQVTYAIGRLVLFKPAATGPVAPDHLITDDIATLALANPRTAPYGAAALQAIEALSLTDLIKDKLVYGQTIAQTYQFVAGGAADAGFVARSQVREQPTASVWLVPSDHHAPLAQDAVLLKRAQDNEAARAFWAYLTSAPGRSAIKAAGYDLPLAEAPR
ncbi:MAG: molybdate ABC transporter substrate-binding protein [Pseudomonadota bacterium]